MRKGMGSPYFQVPTVVGEIEPGPLGFIEREERIHSPQTREGVFDQTRFGLTTEKVREIADHFRDPNHRVVVVVGPTGSGKSTALPYWLVYPPEGVEEDFFTRDGQILVTQPRIVAVTGITEYLGADLMGSSIGAGYDIGYSYSKEDKSDWRNAIEFTTDGKLINWIVAGRISQYGLILIDEAHERSENIETILRLLKDRMKLYPNLKLIIASATIDAEFFRQYYEQEGAAVVEFEGKARVDSQGKPVSYEVFYATEDERINYEEVGSSSKAILKAAFEKAKWLAEEIVARRKDWGDILIFLQGKRPIEQLVEQLRAWANQDEDLVDILQVFPLYREVDKEVKDKILNEDPEAGKLRIVVSTNIAEASVTVDSVIYEIETGVEIQPNFKAEIGATEYPLVLISKANAKQRWGRTGRTRNGEVYCLYTEDQFNSLFLDYPIPAMQRSSMESVVLTAKVAGIPDVVDGWLQNPPEDEIERSTASLKGSGALSESATLTQYGLMVRSFSYAPRLFDILMAADDWGCAVEMATILPVIKNDGVRRLLSWRFSWDAYTKLTAFRRQQALMAGCRDDVEFILKLYKAWSELPWLSGRELNGLTDEEFRALRKQWAELNFVNHKVMLEIEEERSQTLDRLGVNTKESARGIDLMQMSRTRTLLRMMLVDSEVKPVSEMYQYESEVEPESGTLATCRLLDQEVINSETWIELPQTERVEGNIFSRLFAEQVYPVGFRFVASIVEQNGNVALIRTTKNLTRKEALAEQREVVLSDEDDEFNGDEQNGDIEETISEGISLLDISPWYRSVTCNQVIYGTEPLDPNNEYVVEIVGIEIDEDSVNVVAELVPDPEPFEVFAKRHRHSDEVSVEVVDLLQFPDSSAALVVRDNGTGLEVLVEPQDMSFTRNAHAVTSAPHDERAVLLTLNVEHIDVNLRRVRLTNWENVENAISDRFVTSEGDDETTVIPANVVEIRDDGKVMFALDLGETPGISAVAAAYGDRLPKAATEYEVGEQVVLKVYRRAKARTHAELVSLPKKAQSSVMPEERDGELSWKRGTLRFIGRMTYDKLYELKSIADKSLDFVQALEKLYWHANMVYVAQFIDSGFYAQMQEEVAVGSTIDNAVVTEINKGGIVVELSGGIKGFVPNSKILGGIDNASSLLQAGDVVQVKVLEHRIDQGEPLLEVTGGIKDPFDNIVVGQIYQGTVEGVGKFGIFVILSSTITGRVKHSEIFKGGNQKAEELYESGQLVTVKVLSVDRNGRKVELTMKIPENDPVSSLQVGQELNGVVVNMTQHGAFVRIAPTMDGLLRSADFPKSSGFLGLGGPPKIEVGTKLLVRVKSIRPNRRNPSKKDVDLEYIRRIN